jgi:hypothetical protein
MPLDHNIRCRSEFASGQTIIDSVKRIAASAAQRIEAGALNKAGIGELAVIGKTQLQTGRVTML